MRSRTTLVVVAAAGLLLGGIYFKFFSKEQPKTEENKLPRSKFSILTQTEGLRGIPQAEKFVSRLHLRNKLRSISAQNKTVAPTAMPTQVHEHTAFAIFTNGIKRDFTDKKYHKRNPDVYIGAENPGIVHKHKSGITWGNFFDTLPKPMKVTKACLTTGTGQEFCSNQEAKLSFYLNGKFVDNALEAETKDGDRLLMSFGVENETEVRNQFLKVENPEEAEKE